MVDEIAFSKLIARVELLERQVSFLLEHSNSTYVDKITPNAYPDVAELKKRGNLIEAIKLYRSYTGASLADAKTYVENMLV